MVGKEIFWSEKPSKRFIIYYSFLHFNGLSSKSPLSTKGSVGPIALTILILYGVFGTLYLLINAKAREYSGLGGPIALALGLVLVGAPYVIYVASLRKSYQYAITADGVEITGGVIAKRTRNIPFSKITEVKISQNILEKLVGIYELHVYTTDSQPYPFIKPRPEISFFALKDPDTPKNLILHNIKQAGNGNSERLPIP